MPLLNLAESDRGTHVYRIMKEEHLYALFTNRANVLVSPSKWEDPFENFILASPVKTPGGELGHFAFHSEFYGQCWTLNRASDAMWRIYSPKMCGIRVRSTIGRLIDGLTATIGHRAIYKAHLGKVEYARMEALKKECEAGVQMTPDASGLAKTLLIKRWAFKHEREVRLLYLADTGEKVPNGLFSYQVDPHSMVEQLMVDPRLSTDEARQFKADIQLKTGFAGPIKRSLLYAPPKGFITQMRL